MWEEKLFIAVPEGPETFVKKSAEDLDLLLCSTFVHKQVWLLSSLKNTEGYFHLVQGKTEWTLLVYDPDLAAFAVWS